MRGRLIATIAAASWAALSCLPTIPPDWLIDDPTILGIQPVVIKVGPNARPLSEDPPGVTRADTLPGDTVRLVPLVVDAGGPLDLEALQPIWLRCRVRCEQNLFEARTADAPVIACSAPMGQKAPLCQFGAGPTGDYKVLGGKEGFFEDFMMITGTPGGRSSEACLAAILADQDDTTGDLFDCLYVARRVSFGPLKDLLLAQEEPELDPEPVPEVDPNYNPVIDHLAVTIYNASGSRSLEAHDGDVIDVVAGESVRVEVIPAPGTIQEIATPGGLTREEALVVSWFLSAELDAVDADDRLLWQRFSVPTGVSTFDEYAVLRDNRTSITWARLRWQVVDE